MTTSKNVRFLVGKCSCGRIARGTELKKHVAAFDGHEKRVLKRVCVVERVECGKDEAAEDFYKKHKECESGKITDSDFKAWFEGLLLEDEENEAVKTIEAAVEKATEERVIKKAPVVPVVRVIEKVPVAPVVTDADLDRDLAMSEMSSEEEESEVRGVVMQKKKSVVEERDATMRRLFGDKVTLGKPKASSSPQKDQRSSDCFEYNQMKDRMSAMENTNKRVLAENELLKGKVSAIKQMKEEMVMMMEAEKRWSEEKKEMMAKVSECDELKRVLKKQKAECERLRVIAKDVDEVRAINEKLGSECERMSGLLKRGVKRSYEVHLPLYENDICDVPTMTDDPDITQMCYEGEGVKCLHLNLKIDGQLEDFIVRKVKKKKPSKLL